MYHFFVEEEQIEEKLIRITGSDVNHIRNVLRMKPKEELLISSRQGGDYHCAVETVEEDEVCVRILWKESLGRELSCEVILFQGLPKGDKMELVIQKNVELGVTAIVPVAMKRCVVKLDEKKAAAKQKRWQQIAESAAKQSKRGIIPEVKPVMGFSEALAYAKALDRKLLPYECAEGMQRTKQLLASILPGQKVGIFIGPEGGFEEQEVEAAEACGFQVMTLGRRILRTETAGMMLMSVLSYLLEE